jgi:hypothetical protein
MIIIHDVVDYPILQVYLYLDKSSQSPAFLVREGQCR